MTQIDDFSHKLSVVFTTATYSMPKVDLGGEAIIGYSPEHVLKDKMW